MPHNKRIRNFVRKIKELLKYENKWQYSDFRDNIYVPSNTFICATEIDDFKIELTGPYGSDGFDCLKINGKIIELSVKEHKKLSESHKNMILRKTRDAFKDHIRKKKEFQNRAVQELREMDNITTDDINAWANQQNKQLE